MTTYCYRFGDYRLDAGAREIWRGEARLSLPPKSFDCLAYLIEHRERAVGRDELISAVWGRLEVSDALVTQTLVRARRAIGDTGNEQATVRTVPRFGYRWVAPVLTETTLPGEPNVSAYAAPSTTTDLPESQAATAADVAICEPQIPIPGGLPVWSIRRIAIAVAALVLLAVALFAWTSRQPHPAGAHSAADQRPLVLVTPVEVQNADAESAWIRLGAMDYLATHLREDGKLRVLPSEQAISLAGQGDRVDPRSASELHRLELASGATHVLVPRATQIGEGWDIVLDVYHDGGMASFEASAKAPLLATHLVAVHFLESLGISVAIDANSVSARGDALQRIDAAMLAGDLDEARRLVESMPESDRHDPNLAIRAGRLAFRFGQLDEAEKLLQPFARADPTLPITVRAHALFGLGSIASRRQNFAGAEHYYSLAITTVGDHGEPDLLGSAYMERGTANGFRNQFDAADTDFSRARVELERAGDRLGIAGLGVNIGIVEARRGRYADAVKAFDLAIPIFVRFGVRDILATTLLDKISAQLVLLDLSGALETSARAWEAASHLENPFLVRQIALARTRTLLACGQLTAAASLINRFSPTPDAPDTDPEFLILRTQLFVEQGNFAAATAHADTLLDRVEHPADSSSMAPLSEATWVLVEAALRNGDPNQARRLLARFQTTTEPSSQDDTRAFGLEIIQAEILAAQGDAAATAHFAKASAIAEQSGRRDNGVIVAVAHARFMIDHHQLDDATIVAGRLAPFADHDFDAARAVSALYTALGDHALAGAAQAQMRILAGERDLRHPL